MFLYYVELIVKARAVKIISKKAFLSVESSKEKRTRRAPKKINERNDTVILGMIGMKLYQNI